MSFAIVVQLGISCTTAANQPGRSHPTVNMLGCRNSAKLTSFIGSLESEGEEMTVLLSHQLYVFFLVWGEVSQVLRTYCTLRDILGPLEKR